MGSSRERSAARRRFLPALLATLLLTGVFTLVPAPPPAVAASYSAPAWLPIRGSELLGCVKTNCAGSGHTDWALDIPMGRMTPIYATGSGKVIGLADDQGGNCNPAIYPTLADCPDGKEGNTVLIDHGGDVYSLYGHFQTVLVDVGDMVTEGTVLGGAGDSGWSPPGFVHLHYEEWKGFLWAGGQRTKPRSLKACHGTETVTYPSAAGSSEWNNLAGFRVTMRHDGDCNPNGPKCITHFVDALGSHPFCREIEWMVESGITTGFPDGLFHPVSKTSRQASVAFLYRYAGSPPGPFPDPGFADVPLTHLFYKEIAWAVSEGIVEGFDDGLFKDSRNVSRQAFIAWLHRIAGSPRGPFPSSGLKDVVPGEPFFDEVSWGVSVDLIAGYDDGTFKGSRSIARQAGSAFLYRFDDL